MPKKLFTPQQLQKIEEAVKQAESKSAGEIVPVFIRQSSLYEIALWRGGVAAAIAGGIALIILYFVADWLLFMPPYFWLLIPLTLGLLGSLLVTYSPGLKRALIGKELMQSKTLEKAKAVFLDLNISNTDQRSGILLMISFFEKRAIILADLGIAELVPDTKWKEIVDQLAIGIRSGNPTQSICDAISKCGKVLSESGLQRSDDDRNELSDTIIFES